MADPSGLPDIRLDTTQLFREDSFTDRRVGTLRRLVPVTADGADDPSRPVEFEGHATLMTQAGALPLNFAIDATSVNEALEKFPDAAKAAIQNMMEEMERMRREQASSILVPGQGGPGGGLPPGAGGGRIQF